MEVSCYISSTPPKKGIGGGVQKCNIGPGRSIVTFYRPPPPPPETLKSCLGGGLLHLGSPPKNVSYIFEVPPLESVATSGISGPLPPVSVRFESCTWSRAKAVSSACSLLGRSNSGTSRSISSGPGSEAEGDKGGLKWAMAPLCAPLV